MAVSRRSRILVVEDDPEVATAIRRRLIHEGYAVTVALDGLEALDAFAADRPDLVTVDLHVPTVSGYRLVQLFKHDGAEVRILVVTSASFEEAEELAKLGVEGFITKPFGLGELVREIEAILAGRVGWQSDSIGDRIET